MNLKQQNKIKNSIRCSVGGFTIVELMIASAVFSVVLIGALAGFLQLGRVFYKGTALTDTNSVTRQILNDVSDNIQSASSVSPAQSDTPYNYYCVGNTRYTYKIGRAVNTATTDNLKRNDTYGLIKDKLTGANACAPPCPLAPAACEDGQSRWSSPVELLGDNMRLQDFKIQSNPSISPDYYTVNVVVAYGDSDLFELATSGDESSIRCKGTSSQGEQFCAVGRFSTSIKRGINI